MSCIKCAEDVFKEDEIKCSNCKISAHYYCYGINENNFNNIQL